MDVTRGVDAGDNPLRAGFFVTGRAVDLSGVEESADALCLQRRPQLGRVNHVVLDGVAGTEHHSVLKARNLAHQFALQICWQAGREAVQVSLVGMPAFWFKKQLMALFIGEFDDLVFDRRAVARADAEDLAAVERRAVKVVADHLMNARVRVTDIAGDLRLHNLARREGEWRRLLVARLFFELLEVNGPTVEARRSASLQTRDAETEMTEIFGELDGGKFARPSSGESFRANVDQAVEEGSRRDDYCFGAQQAPIHQLNTCDAVVFN